MKQIELDTCICKTCGEQVFVIDTFEGVCISCAYFPPIVLVLEKMTTRGFYNFLRHSSKQDIEIAISNSTGSRVRVAQGWVFCRFSNS